MHDNYVQLLTNTTHNLPCLAEEPTLMPFHIFYTTGGGFPSQEFVMETAQQAAKWNTDIIDIKHTFKEITDVQSLNVHSRGEAELRNIFGPWMRKVETFITYFGHGAVPLDIRRSYDTVRRTSGLAPVTWEPMLDAIHLRG